MLSFKLTATNAMLELSYQETPNKDMVAAGKKRKTYQIKFPGELNELKYFVSSSDTVGDSDVTIFLSLCIDKTSENSLLSLSDDVYKPDGSCREKKYIVVECQSEEELLRLIAAVKATLNLRRFVTAEAKLTAGNKKEYCRSLEEVKSGYCEGKRKDSTLFQYPFAKDVDADEIDKATRDLRELSPPPCSAATLRFNNAATDDEEDKSGGAVLNILVRDYLRLDAPIYFNDTLIDFWMKW